MADDSRHSTPPSKFDLRYLKVVIDDLQSEIKKRGEVMDEFKVHMATTNQLLDQMQRKYEEHEAVQKEHANRIHKVEMKQAGCTAEMRLHGHDIELRRLNSFMDMVKRGSGGEIDTSAVDTHAQRMQAAAETAIVNSLPIKLHLARLWPFIILVAIFCIVITTLIMARVATGTQVELPKIEDIPGVEIKANSSSQGEK